MTGPEHYHEAERLLNNTHDEQYTDPHASLRLTAAQAHAILALAAATAMQAAVDGSEPGMGSEEFHAWYVAAGVKPIRPGAPDAEEDHDDAFSASELYEMDQADEAALDAAADAPEGGDAR